MTPDRREFLKTTTTAFGAVSLSSTGWGAAQEEVSILRQTFSGPDSLFHGPDWETQNPGYWQIRDGALRRRLTNVGDRARRTGFPFHSSHGSNPKGPGKMEVEYDPSLPAGYLWRRDWKLKGDFTVEMDGVFRGARPSDIPEEDDAEWKMYNPGHGWCGIALGGKGLFEGYQKVLNPIVAGWTDAEPPAFALEGAGRKSKSVRGRVAAPDMQVGDAFSIRVSVNRKGGQAIVKAILEVGEDRFEIPEVQVNASLVEGYVGIVGRGLIDFEVSEFRVSGPRDSRLEIGHCECLGCWAIGDSLKEVDGKWQVKFMTLFGSEGEKAEVRISTEENPAEGWESVPVAGSASIVNHEWRRNTAVITATFPENPGDVTHYYTVWKDGANVTADSRIGTDAVGPGTGFVGDVPGGGDYVGRLPRLVAPYKLAGLSCHAITGGLQRKSENGYEMIGRQGDWEFRDQPTEGAYRHLEEYDLQIMVWEDDVWYMELVLYPPSTDDAYKVVANSICGPTSRWQMMRHWNVINPGDHDYGMDDVKGPEQIAIRKFKNLGQDPEYMKRNFQIVHHLVTGEEEVDPLINPKKWRAWKMPNRDFTFVICDSRLWRSSQDTDIWDDAGWGAFKNLYDRTDPTRSLLGEEQFAWLQELIATDSSPLICLTGVNGLHTIWTGRNWGDGEFKQFDQRDRVTADYAGWVKAGADRVLELLGSRDGVVTVYGDVHNGCIMTNREHGVVEACFGPIGRSGGRGVIDGFGPKMKDFDGRSLAIHSLYHKQYAGPDLEGHGEGEPFYWNFLEMEFDPTQKDPVIEMRVRNLVDSPEVEPRGGGVLETVASETGREPGCRVPAIQTLPNADVRFVDAASGKTIRGTRSRADGSLPVAGLVDVSPGTEVLVVAWDGSKSESMVVETMDLQE